MKIYKLTRNHTKYSLIYDCQNGVIVRANDEAEARKIASESHGDEGEDVWLNENSSTCEELLQDGPAELLLYDFNAG